MKKAVKWVIVNAMLAACIWLAIWRDNVGAGRVVMFVEWLGAICGILAVMCESAKAKVKEEGRSVPAFVSVSYDIAEALILVWFGWWWTAIAVLLSMFAIAAIHDKEATK